MMKVAGINHRAVKMNERTLGTSPRLRLLAWAQSRIGREFQWGRTNCLMLCLEAMDVLSNGHLADTWRSQCSNIRDVIRNTRRLSAESELEKAGLAKIDGPPHVGDLIVGLPPHYRQFSGHVVLGDYCISSNPKQGVGYLVTRDVLAQPHAAIWRYRG